MYWLSFISKQSESSQFFPLSPRQGVIVVVQIVTIRVTVRVVTVAIDERGGGGGGA